MSLDRPFYAVVAVFVLIVTALGFQEFFLHGKEFGGDPISPGMFPFVIVHGVAVTAWSILLLVQALLIAGRRRQIHIRIGLGAIALAVIIVISGFLVAVRSVQASPLVIFWGMEYRQFLLVMLTEVASFGLFFLVGFLNRKRPARHRAMMVLATMALIAGATLRLPVLYPIFGLTGWQGIFGPLFVLGAVILVARSLMQRTLDTWFAAGFAVMVVTFVLAVTLATGGWWSHVAHRAFKG